MCLSGKWASDVMKRTLTKSKSKSRVTVFALFLARVNAVHHIKVNTVLDIVIETERKPDSTIGSCGFGDETHHCLVRLNPASDSLYNI